MTYAQILEIEDCNVDKVYFYKEGMFLKAYEHSAFLVCRYIHDFKVSRRRVLAAAGGRLGVEVDYPGSYGNYWSSTLKVPRMPISCPSTAAMALSAQAPATTAVTTGTPSVESRISDLKPIATRAPRPKSCRISSAARWNYLERGITADLHDVFFEFSSFSLTLAVLNTKV